MSVSDMRWLLDCQFGFTVTWPRTKLTKDTSIVLAFDDEDEAYHWHAAFVGVISSLIPVPGEVATCVSTSGEAASPTDSHAIPYSPDFTLVRTPQRNGLV